MFFLCFLKIILNFEKKKMETTETKENEKMIELIQFNNNEKAQHEQNQYHQTLPDSK